MIDLTLPAEHYHDDRIRPGVPSLSASIATILCTRSPLHAWAAHPKLNPNYVREEKPHYDVGTAAHAILLEGSDRVVTIVDAADWRTKAAQEAREQAYTAGRVPLLPHVYEQVTAMVAAAREQLAAHQADPPLFTDGTPEATLVWEEGDVLCRARLDWLRDDQVAIDDLKTTSRSASPDQWSRTLFATGRDIQAAFHMRGHEAVTGEKPLWRFAVIETDPPYALTVMSLSPAALELANAKVDWAITKWQECLATDRWPGYPTDTCYAEPSAWDEARWLEKEIAVGKEAV